MARSGTNEVRVSLSQVLLFEAVVFAAPCLWSMICATSRAPATPNRQPLFGCSYVGAPKRFSTRRKDPRCKLKLHQFGNREVCEKRCERWNAMAGAGARDCTVISSAMRLKIWSKRRETRKRFCGVKMHWWCAGHVVCAGINRGYHAQVSCGCHTSTPGQYAFNSVSDTGPLLDSGIPGERR
jgi:hypothetical protein